MFFFMANCSIYKRYTVAMFKSGDKYNFEESRRQ